MISVAWLWHQVILPSWLSLLSAPFILVAYVLLGRRLRVGWWFTIASQSSLVVIAFVNRQYGLLTVLLLMFQAFRNWRAWGRPDPRIEQLAAEARHLPDRAVTP